MSAAQLLGENTLAIADTLVLAPDDNGNLALMFRCALAALGLKLK